MRHAEVSRKTAETDVALVLELEGRGAGNVDTSCGFLDHMLALFARHGRFDLDLMCRGDTQVDDHHIVEDVGICLGEAFAQSLGDKRGIFRYGSVILPMDEALILSSVDLSGRAYLGWEMNILTQKVGTFDTELAKEFWLAFTRSAACTLHFRQLAGENSHHIIEGAFKSAARSLHQAVTIDPNFSDEIPSTKGVL
ncbi:MAG: imidazoleglycerol-phosphate dehydratase HisB [Fretibacterium sp.]|nr:imidazoleglycerol-phosphate dehydratase HisB [Fretibacterium sp.]